MKADQLVVYRASAPMNDYLYQLTEPGRERARRFVEHCTYFGAAPVTLDFGPHQLRGRGMRVGLNQGTLRLESNVNGQFIP